MNNITGLNLDNKTTEQLISLLTKATQPHYKGEHIRFTDYAHSYLQGKKDQIALNTCEKYEGYYKNYFVPAFDGLMLTDMTKDKVQSFIHEIAKKLKPPTIHDMISSVLQPILNEAVDEGLTERNLAKNVKCPKVRKATTKRAFTNEEIRNIFIAAKGHYQWGALPLLFYTGLRRSELLPLTWDDVDFEHRIIHINKALVTLNNGYVLNDYNKTESSTRTITMNESLAKCLMYYKEHIQHNKNHYVISQKKTDHLVDPNNFSRTVRTWVRKAGIKDKIGIHAFRHSFITISIENGTPWVVIKQQTGHTSDDMLERYLDKSKAASTRREADQRIEEYAKENNIFDASSLVC